MNRIKTSAISSTAKMPYTKDILDFQTNNLENMLGKIVETGIFGIDTTQDLVTFLTNYGGSISGGILDYNDNVIYCNGIVYDMPAGTCSTGGTWEPHIYIDTYYADPSGTTFSNNSKYPVMQYNKAIIANSGAVAPEGHIYTDLGLFADAAQSPLIYNYATKSYVESFNTDLVKTSKINIGSWDMDATATKTISLTAINPMYIFSVNVIIYNDDTSEIYPINYNDDTVSAGDWRINNTDLLLMRNVGGTFDSTYFNATNVNRGFVVIQYI